MVSSVKIIDLLLLCLLLSAGSSDAFAVVRHAHGPSLQFGVCSSSSPSIIITSRTTTTTLSMSSSLPPPELKPPLAMYEGAVAAGAAKANSTFGKIFKLGIVAGCHIAFGAYLSISVGGACPGLAETNPGLQKIIMVRVLPYVRACFFSRQI
jgi:Formate/nitrite transporter